MNSIIIFRIEDFPGNLVRIFNIIECVLSALYLTGEILQKCPFEAIQIINLPKDLDKDTTHRYGPNSFKLHR